MGSFQSAYFMPTLLIALLLFILLTSLLLLHTSIDIDAKLYLKVVSRTPHRIIPKGNDNLSNCISVLLYSSLTLIYNHQNSQNRADVVAGSQHGGHKLPEEAYRVPSVLGEFLCVFS